MKFEILGPLRVTVGNDPLALGSPQQQKLLALLLAAQNRPIATDRLIDDMWGDDPPPSARHLIQVYVSRLRAVLDGDGGDSRFSNENDGYLVHVEPEELDASGLSGRITSARALMGEDPGAAARELAEIVAMRRGRPFGDLGDDCPALQAHSVRLEQTLLGAVAALVAARLELGHHTELIPDLEALTREHPYHEEFWAQRMLALYRSGRQTEALRTYQDLSRILGEDLGIEPTPEVRHLEERILLQDIGLLWDIPPPPNNLPDPLTSFVGREAELAEVTKLVDTFRLVTLTGPGGIGKTRLAIETARSLQLRFPDGIWWVDLAPLVAPGDVVVELARVLGIADQPGTSPVDSVARALLRRRALLVIDNCEHLAVAVADVVGHVLPHARDLSVLTTSRVPLHVSGEARWQVPSLALPSSSRVLPAALPAADAIALFLARGSAADPMFELSDANSAAVVEVCRRLDGMPLAIEMAAARLDVLAPAQLVGALSDRLNLLGQPAVETDPRHQTLQAALDWSYELLAPRDQVAFERLSVFAGTFDLDAAAAVVRPGDSMVGIVGSIAALLEASMLTSVRLEPSVKHYRMLETLRTYGARRLEMRGETDRIHRRYAGYVLGLLVQAGATIDTPDFAPWVTRIGGYHADLQRALAWSLAHESGTMALRAAPALFHYWFRMGDARQSGRWAGQMLEQQDGSSPEFVAAAHLSAGFSATILGDPDAAIGHARAAAAIYEKSGENRGLVHALFGMAQWALQVGDLDTAQECSERALVICGELEDPWSRAGPLVTLSFVQLFGGGSLADARRFAEEAHTLYRELDDVGGQVVMNPLSAIAMRQGDLEAAMRYATEAVAIAGGVTWEATALVNLAEVQMAAGETHAAEASLRRGLTRALDGGLENWFRVALRDLAVVAQSQGEPRRSALLGGGSRRNMPQWGLDPGIYESLQVFGREALGADRFERLAGEGSRMSHERLLDLALESTPDRG